jgi:DNA-binding response OmpR family regulator
MRGNRKHSGFRRKAPLVLVVAADDEDKTVAYLKYAGFQVEACLPGERAFERAKAEEPGVVLVDLGHAGGLDLVRRLKSEEKTSQALVIALGNEEHIAEAHAAGRDAPQRLVGAVMRALGSVRRFARDA